MIFILVNEDITKLEAKVDALSAELNAKLEARVGSLTAELQEGN